MQDQEAVIKLKGVSKTFKLPHERTSSVKSAIINFRRRRTYEQQQVLKNISFEIKKNEFFGIVGRNGSGKSTLLKLIAGIYKPSGGSVAVEGKLTPFIELGVGFNDELTGRENVFLNGALLGFTRKETQAMYHSIVEFAELEQFMDQKLKNYSSGMRVRLAFSIAIRTDADILLFDEVLAVGDAAFQQKCFEVFADLKKRGTTIILVTHDMSAVLRFCDRVILIDNGHIAKEGLPAEVADSYLELNYESSPKAEMPGQKKASQGIPRIQSVKVLDSDGQTNHRFSPGETMQIEIKFKNPKGLPVHFGGQIFNDAGVYCFGTNTKISGLEPTKAKSAAVSLDVTTQLVPGNYYINAATMNDNATTVYDYQAKVAQFRISKVTNLEGIALLDHSWRL